MLKTFHNKIKTSVHDKLFNTIHNRWLIYNTSWEDPRIDRQLLKLDASSKIVMLTSAGCNALDYLLDSPAEIHCVDVNPKQNALLSLKLALIKHCEYDDLYSLFGSGRYNKVALLYKSIRMYLPDYAQKFWDTKIDYFSVNRHNRGFYHRGGAGTIAWLLTRHFLGKNKLRNHLFDFLDAKSLPEQQDIYSKMEPWLWGGIVRWMINQPLVMSLLGVPREQILLIKARNANGLPAYINEKMRHVFTQLSIRDNYFWRVYLTGHYTDDCRPNYLAPDNFLLLKNNVERIQLHNLSVTDFLSQNPGNYSHFVLLDHQDWMAWHDRIRLAQEWEHILDNSTPGSKILMRSAAKEIDFIPKASRHKLRFFPELTNPLHKLDRVGTYESLHFAEIF